MDRQFYTDGSCLKNGFKGSSGGYGAIEIKDDIIIWQYQNFKAPTTNNEMELMAILKVLEYCLESQEKENIIIYTDSGYCYGIITEWMFNWAKRNWTRSGNQEIKNLDIIKKIFNIIYNNQSFESNKKFNFKKIKGHAGNKWNEYVDKLATGKIKI